MDNDLWAKVLDPESKYRRQLIDQVRACVCVGVPALWAGGRGRQWGRALRQLPPPPPFSPPTQSPAHPQVVSTALPESKNPEQVSVAVKAFMMADLQVCVRVCMCVCMCVCPHERE